MTRRVRSLDEARALVEQSFGNFVGSDVLSSAQDNFTKVRDEIERLQAEDTAEGIYSSLAKGLTKTQLREYKTLSERIAVRLSCIRRERFSSLRLGLEVVIAISHPVLEYLLSGRNSVL